jgi:hypothetical protein
MKIKIIYSAKNIVILVTDDTYVCYSYGKKIATSQMENKDPHFYTLVVDYNQITSEKNKCHLKIFNETLNSIAKSKNTLTY